MGNLRRRLQIYWTYPWDRWIFTEITSGGNSASTTRISICVPISCPCRRAMSHIHFLWICIRCGRFAQQGWIDKSLISVWFKGLSESFSCSGTDYPNLRAFRIGYLWDMPTSTFLPHEEFVAEQSIYVQAVYICYIFVSRMNIDWHDLHDITTWYYVN